MKGNYSEYHRCCEEEYLFARIVQLLEIKHDIKEMASKHNQEKVCTYRTMEFEITILSNILKDFYGKDISNYFDENGDAWMDIKVKNEE